MLKKEKMAKHSLMEELMKNEAKKKDSSKKEKIESAPKTLAAAIRRVNKKKGC